jgi:hypothetical protein
MEIIYFIQVIRIIIGLFSTSTNTENMKGGGVGSMLKIAKKAGVKAGADGKTRIMSAQNKDSLKSSLKTMSGMTTASERVKSADGAIAIYKMIRFIVYMLSAFLVPFMPFYAATKSFFQKGIPFFKEVTVPESVDYEAKMLEKEINEQAQKK